MHTGGLPKSFSEQPSLDLARVLTRDKNYIMVFYQVIILTWINLNFMCMCVKTILFFIYKNK
jgi:hypothetical protein